MVRYQANVPTVFLSYARVDAEMVDRIAADLKAEGFDVWLDRDRLTPGESWVRQVEDAISRSDFLLFFISRSSLNSKWAMAEYHAAFSKLKASGGSSVIPVLLEEIGEVPIFLSEIQYADFTKSYDAGIHSLVTALQTPSGPKPDELIDPKKLAKLVAGELAKLLGLEKKSNRAVVSSEDKALVFVIMSFSPDMEPIFEGIRSAASVVGLDAKRVKDVEGDYRITDKVIELIQTARFVVADLTHERPNVYFELGYARGLGKRVVMIARRETNIHFDVKDWKCLEYIDSRLLERDLKKRFEVELKDLMHANPQSVQPRFGPA